MELKVEVLEDTRIDIYLSKNTEYSRSKIYRIIQQCKDKIKSTLSYREIK